MEDSRGIAIHILQSILEDKCFLSSSPLYATSNDKAFLNMLLRTTLRHLVFIKKIVKRYVSKIPSSPFGKYALYLGICEILYMDTPDYAVPNSYVNIVKQETNKYIGGFVNAVLRKICQNKEQIISEDNGEFFTNEFFKILKKDYNKKTIQKIQASAIKEPLLDITAKNNPQEIALQLGGTLLPNGSIRLENHGNIEKLNNFSNGQWWVQDFSSSLAVCSLSNLKNKNVLDLCAAPGGKTAQLISKGAKVTAVDISAERMQKLKQNLDRLNLQAHEVIVADGLEYIENYKSDKFDIILLDAPCSATGTLRRHPEVVHIKNTTDIANQIAIQEKFLEKTPEILTPNGSLIYCTCSICKDEGEHQIYKFLERHPEFSIKPIDKINGLPQEIYTPEGFIRILPHHIPQGCDAFFIAHLTKKAQ